MFGSQLEVGHMGIVHLTRRSKDSSVSIYKAVQSTGTHPRTASTGQPFLPTVSVRQELCLQPTARLLEVLWQSSQHPPKFQTGQVSSGPHHVPSQKVCYALIPLPGPPWVPSPSDHPRLWHPHQHLFFHWRNATWRERRRECKEEEAGEDGPWVHSLHPDNCTTHSTVYRFPFDCPMVEFRAQHWETTFSCFITVSA